VNVLVPGAPTTRNDVIFSVVAGIHHSFRNWLAVTLDYRFTDDATDFRYMPSPGVSDNPGYMRHELLLGMRAAL
jgi:hypothetical protein